MKSQNTAAKFGKFSRKRMCSRKTRSKRRSQLSFENLESRNVLATLTFVDVGSAEAGYHGTHDTLLFSIRPDTNFGTDTAVSVDQQDVNGARQGLLRFDNIFTNTGEVGKIPY